MLLPNISRHSLPLLLSASLLLVSLVFCGSGEAAMTTENLKKVMIGRCEEFKYLEKSILGNRNISCEHLWNLFERVAVNPSTCSYNYKDYETLVQAAEHAVIPDKFMFWSDCQAVIIGLQRTSNFFSIEKALIGYMADNIEWCRPDCAASDVERLRLRRRRRRLLLRGLADAGEKESGRISQNRSSRTEMPTSSLQGDTNCEPFSLTYWKAASEWFAKKAAGEVTVLLNGTREEPFLSSSIFGSFELPHLLPPRVTRVRVLVFKELDKEQTGGDCSSESVKELMMTLQRQGVQAECKDDPDFVRHLLCIEKPHYPGCKLAVSSGWMPLPSLLLLLLLLLLQMMQMQV